MVSHGVEGVNVDPNGEGRHEREASKKIQNAKRQGKKVKNFEPEKESYSGGIRRNTGLRERSKWLESGGG